MIKYAGVNFANSFSQWEARVCSSDKKARLFWNKRHTDKKVKREWESHLPLETVQIFEVSEGRALERIKKTCCHPFLGQDLHMHVNYE
jgi:hypothetical protein